MTMPTKAQIDALVEAATNGRCDCIPALFIPRDLGKDNSVVEARHLKRTLYLAAGLNADGSEKPNAVRVFAVFYRGDSEPGPGRIPGTWDGTTFTPESTKQPPLCLSCGKHKERCDGC